MSNSLVVILTATGDAMLPKLYPKIRFNGEDDAEREGTETAHEDVDLENENENMHQNVDRVCCDKQVCRGCFKHVGEVFGFHKACWNAIRSTSKPFCTTRSLLGLSRALVTSYTESTLTTTELEAICYEAFSEGLYQYEVNRDLQINTDLGQLLANAQKLPLELQSAISAQLESCLTKSILTTLSTRRLLKEIYSRAASASNQFIRLTSSDLLYHTIQCMGKEYLSQITQPQNPRECERPRVVGSKLITGIKFALGLHGIRAIQLLGPWGVSGWTGDISTRRSLYGRRRKIWIGSVMVGEVCKLRIHSDVSIRFKIAMDVS